MVYSQNSKKVQMNLILYKEVERNNQLYKSHEHSAEGQDVDESNRLNVVEHIYFNIQLILENSDLDPQVFTDTTELIKICTREIDFDTDLFIFITDFFFNFQYNTETCKYMIKLLINIIETFQLSASIITQSLLFLNEFKLCYELKETSYLFLNFAEILFSKIIQIEFSNVSGFFITAFEQLQQNDKLFNQISKIIIQFFENNVCIEVSFQEYALQVLNFAVETNLARNNRNDIVLLLIFENLMNENFIKKSIESITFQHIIKIMRRYQFKDDLISLVLLRILNNIFLSCINLSDIDPIILEKLRYVTSKSNIPSSLHVMILLIIRNIISMKNISTRLSDATISILNENRVFVLDLLYNFDFCPIFSKFNILVIISSIVTQYYFEIIDSDFFQYSSKLIIENQDFDQINLLFHILKTTISLTQDRIDILLYIQSQIIDLIDFFFELEPTSDSEHEIINQFYEIVSNFPSDELLLI